MKIKLKLESDEVEEILRALSDRAMTLNGVIARTRKSIRAHLEERLELAKRTRASVQAQAEKEKE